MDNFNEYPKPKNLIKKEEKILTYGKTDRLLQGIKNVLNGFRSRIIPTYLQHFLLLKASNTSESLLNDIRQIIHSSY